jgi:hypothetical protein
MLPDVFADGAPFEPVCKANHPPTKMGKTSLTPGLITWTWLSPGLDLCGPQDQPSDGSTAQRKPRRRHRPGLARGYSVAPPGLSWNSLPRAPDLMGSS